ncbi:Uncharacterised protein (plasmid) [Tsukamurella tyrosinosolvens]|uniref:ATPase family associated with various cellular activities (AAA) n=1 Tax=Tsukamurella tyrosinosolvens TaxID=57704 RepID=A0A1H4UK37_TSUTY|nr:AAA family ATPase [Tsukamurella tyrosinosolvens]KXO99048.1 hypothetical protein AXK58_24140 [Tsukamurella tyrosinosolvens]SEC69045.1 ATPase family associated with various cellular activities (AAA) [Tsukamurella tyrosinosolvens]VEH94282.1 Uncharacterised protein [Tsukamurella tyrosinosolvens]
MAVSTPTTVLDHGGGTYRVTSAHAAPQELQPGTYTLTFSQLAGYSIVTLPDLQPPTYRVYGRRDATIAKVLRTYEHSTRALGVLFEGDKGIGKSSTTVELARQARDQFQLPVILVNHATPGLSDFLGSLGEVVIVFDEFEKNFPRSDDNGDQQAQFLTLFDGTDSTKRLYILTVNDTLKLSQYLLNRPGRLHYLISFDYPDTQAVRDYITNEAAGASAKQVSDVVSFAYRARLNYDHLRAIATEITIAGPDAAVSELVADLNIRDTVDLVFDVTLYLADGTTLKQKSLEVDLFAQEQLLWVDLPATKKGMSPEELGVTFAPSDVVLNDRTGVLALDGHDIQKTELDFGYGQRGLEGLSEWEQELLKSARSGDGRVDLGDAPEEYAKYKVARLELLPAVNTRGRFAL